MSLLRLYVLLVGLCLACFIANAQAQNSIGRVTIKAVGIYGQHNASNENEDYRFKFWFNDDLADAGGNCLKVNQITHHTWIDVNYTLVSNKSFDINTPITIYAKAWEEDGCGDDCSYDGSCGNDDEGVCDKTTGRIQANKPSGSSISLSQNSTSFMLNDIIPGNRTDNLIELWFCGDNYRVHLLVTYIPPQPDEPTISIEGRVQSDNGDNICDDSLISLTTQTTIKPEHRKYINYTWQYRISGETSTTWIPNPLYCGDTQDCSGYVPPPPGENLKSSKKQAFFTVDPGGGAPPCCAEPQYIPQTVPVWRTISGTPTKPNEGDGLKQFKIRSLSGLTNITKNTTIEFRVVAEANGLSSSYSFASSVINLSPVGPVIGNVITDASCPNKNSGVIHVTGISGVGEYKYFLKPGYNNNSPCDPEANDCFSGILSGSTGPGPSGPAAKIIKPIEDDTTIVIPPPDPGFNGSEFKIYNVPYGEFTLWLENHGTKKGNCYSTDDTVTVLKIPELSLQLTDLKPVTCSGGSNAEITLSKTGGIEPYVFSLKTGSDSTGNSTGLFSGLSVGTFVAKVTDGCSQDSTTTVQTLIVKQPAKVYESLFDSDDATCINPGNGQLSTDVLKSTGAYDTIVSGTFLYRLFKNDTLYDSEQSPDPTWARGNLPVSNNYQLVVTENGSLDCNSYTKTFSVAAPPPLSITNLNISNVDCFEGSNGSITFDGTGGSGSFAFKLSKAAETPITNTIGDFLDINAGNYLLIIENNLPGCMDKVSYPDTLKVSQPDSIAISLAKNDITCFGYNDGNIFASVSGGTPGYTFEWEERIGSAWNTVNTGSTLLSDQPAGTFRLKVIDSKSCPDLSGSVSIAEPDPMDINTAIVNDIKCLGEKGTINILSAGGIQPHSYEYSLNGLPFTSFTNLTPLSSGNYVVKAIDQNGCSFTDLTHYPITSPPAALDFTFNQSDFNGFNISCYGGSNGSITLTPTGGNGATYSGYQYAMDGGSYQVPNLISNINASTHSITAIDGRGCIVSKDILFTQTNELLAVQLANTQDVVCYGDLTGSIEVQGSGGLSPYLFNIDSSPNQSSTQFSSLGVGTYVIGITDLNGCSSTLAESIVTLNPRIQFQSNITEVSCFGGADGMIAINVTDGIQPFQFSWLGQPSTTNELVNVGTGSYTVTVTDNAGCKRDSLFTIAQPNQALQTRIATVPVCFGSTAGEITITTTGGTLPYQYSIDNGNSYQSNNVFNTVGVGTYAIKIKDNKGCSLTDQAVIIQRNDKPEPNFLAATRQNALDTLIIKEISVPKPDSIYWIFDPRAIVISDDQWSPQLKFNDAGNYLISMTGFFGGCDYTILKNLQLNPYDPNAVPSKEPNFRAIESADISPNPNTGVFTVAVKLTKKYNLSLIVYNMIGIIHYENSYQQIQELNQSISLPQAAAGIYLLRVITETEARDFRIIVNK